MARCATRHPRSHRRGRVPRRGAYPGQVERLIGLSFWEAEAFLKERQVYLAYRRISSKIVKTSIASCPMTEARERERERTAAEERATREQQQRNRRNAIWVVAGAVVVVVLQVLAGWLALESYELRSQAEGVRLMAAADRLQDFNYGTSLLVRLRANAKREPARGRLSMRPASRPAALLPRVWAPWPATGAKKTGSVHQYFKALASHSRTAAIR